jgi:AcrR family transcriptional regulator
MPTEAGPTRRAQARQRTWRELKAAALAEVRDEGPSGLKLRSVARRLGMSPAGLYRYVDSRDGLLTALIADGYHDLADHLEVALGTAPASLPPRDRPDPVVPVVVGPEGPHADRLVAVGRAYRGWGVAHPNEFGLLFGDPIPGYDAPAAGPTVAAMGRVGSALARPIVAAASVGRLRVDPELTDPALHGPAGALDVLLPDGVDRAVGPLLLLAWGRLHGQVSLEVFGHHRWLFPDGCEALVVADIHRTARDLGLVVTGEERR